jgi:hypothetical protein
LDSAVARRIGIEDDVLSQPAETRRAVRQERSRPIIAEFKPWRREKLARPDQPEDQAGDAIRYTLSRWEGLTRFIHDGRIEIDGNTVKRSIRPIGLNRKNALFAGSDSETEHWAVIAS